MVNEVHTLVLTARERGRESLNLEQQKKGIYNEKYQPIGNAKSKREVKAFNQPVSKVVPFYHAEIFHSFWPYLEVKVRLYTRRP